MSATVGVLSFSHLRSDPRVSRQIDALLSRYRVVSCGYGEAPAGVAEHLQLPPVRPHRVPHLWRAAQLKLGMADRFYWSRQHVQAAQAALHGRSFDLLVANDLDALPVALSYARVLFDAHEYAPLENADDWLWKFFFTGYRTALCRKYLPRAALMTSVCQEIAERYAAEFGVRCEVLTNASARHALPVRPTDPSRIRMIYHGAASRSRRTHLMVELLDHLDGRFNLDLVLVPGEADYIEEIRRRAAPNPRIGFPPPVPMQELVRLSARYDVGLVLMAATNFNNEMGLPNKFFEFIQARLALAIGPSPAMARLVRQHDCGIVAEDYDPAAVGRALQSLTAADLDRMKAGADRAAGVLNAERNREHFLALVQRLI